MPLPTLICLAFSTGIAAALAGRVELRVSPRPPLLTHSFVSYVIFACLVLVPISVYFYVFHGDWFLLYAMDIRRIPSALALVVFAMEVGIGALGFLTGAALVRAQRDAVATVLLVISAAAAIGVGAVARGRLSVVGTYAQYVGNFGLEPFWEHPLMTGAGVMSAIFLVGIASLLGRLHASGRRGD